VKLLRVGPPGAERPALLDAEGTVRDLSGVVRDIDAAAVTSEGLARIATAAGAGDLPALASDGLRVGAPLARPGKVVCIGLNYRDHAEETGVALPAEPVVFLKASDTVVGPYDDVYIPRDSSRTDWEVELAVVIGRRARYLDSAAEALACVAGYAVANDVSEREFQLDRGGQWDKGKSCERFNPLGPWLVTADEIPDPMNLNLQLDLNGERKQQGNTKQMIRDVAAMIEYASSFYTLYPGDIFLSGTPAGVGPIKPGDEIVATIEKVGTMRVFVHAGSERTRPTG